MKRHVYVAVLSFSILQIIQAFPYSKFTPFNLQARDDISVKNALTDQASQGDNFIEPSDPFSFTSTVNADIDGDEHVEVDNSINANGISVNTETDINTDDSCDHDNPSGNPGAGGPGNGYPQSQGQPGAGGPASGYPPQTTGQQPNIQNPTTGGPMGKGFPPGATNNNPNQNGPTSVGGPSQGGPTPGQGSNQNPQMTPETGSPSPQSQPNNGFFGQLPFFPIPWMYGPNSGQGTPTNTASGPVGSGSPSTTSPTMQPNSSSGWPSIFGYPSGGPSPTPGQGGQNGSGNGPLGTPSSTTPTMQPNSSGWPSIFGYPSGGPSATSGPGGPTGQGNGLSQSSGPIILSLPFGGTQPTPGSENNGMPTSGAPGPQGTQQPYENPMLLLPNTGPGSGPPGQNQYPAGTMGSHSGNQMPPPGATNFPSNLPFMQSPIPLLLLPNSPNNSGGPQGSLTQGPPNMNQNGPGSPPRSPVTLNQLPPQQQQVIEGYLSNHGILTPDQLFKILSQPQNNPSSGQPPTQTPNSTSPQSSPNNSSPQSPSNNSSPKSPPDDSDSTTVTTEIIVDTDNVPGGETIIKTSTSIDDDHSDCSGEHGGVGGAGSGGYPQPMPNNFQPGGGVGGVGGGAGGVGGGVGGGAGGGFGLGAGANINTNGAGVNLNTPVGDLGGSVNSNGVGATGSLLGAQASLGAGKDGLGGSASLGDAIGVQGGIGGNGGLDANIGGNVGGLQANAGGGIGGTGAGAGASLNF